MVILGTATDNFVRRMLSVNWLVGLGLISYGMYLWHQPAFSFVRHWYLIEPPKAAMFLASVAVLFISYLSWRYVETPFRVRKKINTKSLVVTLGCAFSVLVSISVSSNIYKGFDNRYSVPNSVSNSFVRTKREKECFNKNDVHVRDDWVCSLGGGSKPASFFIFGDSHALSVLDGFDKSAHDVGISGHFTGISGCLPFMGLYSSFKDQKSRNCRELNDRVFAYIKDSAEIDIIYLVARWSFYNQGGYHGNEWSFVSVDQQSSFSEEGSRDAFLVGLQRTVDAYSEIGVKVVILPQVPQQLVDPKKAYLRSFSKVIIKSKSIDFIDNISVSRDTHSELQSFSNQAFSVYERDPQFELISFDDILCDEYKCPIGDENYSYYFDDDHLSLSGVKRITPAIRNMLNGDFGFGLSSRHLPRFTFDSK